MSADFEVRMMDLATKQFFQANKESGLDVRTAKNGRRAFVCPAPTERKNACWKWASESQITLFSGAPVEEQGQHHDAA